LGLSGLLRRELGGGGECFRRLRLGKGKREKGKGKREKVYQGIEKK
jgi:hypothetical protein